MKRIVSALILSLPLNASAAPTLDFIVPSSLCLDGDELLKKVEGCDQNGLFVDAARKCMAKLDSSAVTVGLDLKKSFKLDAKQAQLTDFKSTAKEYFEMSRKLDYMIAVAESTRVSTFEYKENLVLDDDEGLDGSDEPSAECFTQPRKAIQGILEQMDQKQTQFEQALALTKTQLLAVQASGQNMGTINSSLTTPPVSGVGQGSAAGAAVDGKKVRQSDISGTEDKDKKKKK